MIGKTNSGGSVRINEELNLFINSVSKISYDGTVSKTLDITLASLGAAASDHNHDDKYYPRKGQGYVTFDPDNHGMMICANSQGPRFMKRDGSLYEPFWMGTDDVFAFREGSINFRGTNVTIQGQRIPTINQVQPAGKVKLDPNVVSINLRESPTEAAGIGWDTNSTECLAVMAKSNAAKFKFKVGFDPATFANNTFTPMTNANFEISSEGTYTSGRSYASQFGTNNSMTIVPMSSNEVNFDGTDGSVIWFGYRQLGVKKVPKDFYFGGPTVPGVQPIVGSAAIHATGYYDNGIHGTFNAIRSASPQGNMLWAY